VPCVGVLKTVYVSGRPCGDVAVSVIPTDVSSLVVTAWLRAVGPSDGWKATIAVCHPIAELYWKSPV
jgi:hypothetical protein